MTDLSTPTLAGLAYALRHPELWPAGFVWDGAHPHHNAVKLAFLIWGGPISYDDSAEGYKNDLAKLLCVSVDDAETLLCTHLPEGGAPAILEPSNVARRIEQYLRAAAA